MLWNNKIIHSFIYDLPDQVFSNQNIGVCWLQCGQNFFLAYNIFGPRVHFRNTWKIDGWLNICKFWLPWTKIIMELWYNFSLVNLQWTYGGTVKGPFKEIWIHVLWITNIARYCSCNIVKWSFFLHKLLCRS